MLAWFNDAEHEFFAQAGYPLTRMVARDRTAFVMGRIDFKFIGPAGYGEKIVTRLAVKKITNSTVLWDCSARRSDDALVTKGTATRVYAEIQQNGELQAKRIPNNIRTLLGAPAVAE